jgi:hypothetical protein
MNTIEKEPKMITLMYLKNLVILFICLGVCHSCNSQKITIDNVSVPVEYYRLPDKPLDPEYITYSSEIEARYQSLSMTGLTESSLIDQYLKLPGYKEVSNHGDVQIKALVGDFNVFGERTISRRTKKKNKDGKEEINVTYALELKYEMPIGIKISDKKGNTLDNEDIFTWSDQRTYTTSYYNSISDLDSYWRYSRNSKISDLQRDRIKEGFGKIRDLINNYYGYKLTKENAKFETIGKKKHPDYEKYKNAIEAIQAAFKNMSADKALEGIRKEVLPTLAFYDTQCKAITPKSKEDIKLQHINLYNQALAYYWLELFDQAEHFAKEIQKMDAKDRDAKRLLEDIDSTRSSLERANKKSRHGTMVTGKA